MEITADADIIASRRPFAVNGGVMHERFVKPAIRRYAWPTLPSLPAMLATPWAATLRAAILAFALLEAPPVHAQTADQATAGVEAAVRAFHEAIHAGDVAAIERMLASDAVILEGGQRETRAEYLSHHLQADIEFARAVPSRTRKLDARVIGDVAWVTSTSVSQGTFRNRPINLAGVELLVLARRGAAWEIRAIHWSSRQAK